MIPMKHLPKHIRDRLSPAKATPRRRGMNRWELAYASHLVVLQRVGTVQWWGYEAITLKLADDCRYTPDFSVVLSADAPALMFVEIKGHKRDDAFVKFKVAAKQNPWATFVMLEKDGDRWGELYRYERSMP